MWKPAFISRLLNPSTSYWSTLKDLVVQKKCVSTKNNCSVVRMKGERLRGGQSYTTLVSLQPWSELSQNVLNSLIFVWKVLLYKGTACTFFTNHREKQAAFLARASAWTSKIAESQKHTWICQQTDRRPVSSERLIFIWDTCAIWFLFLLHFCEWAAGDRSSRCKYQLDNGKVIHSNN